MEKEVEPVVLAAINNTRLSGVLRTPLEVLGRLGVPDPRQKAYEHAWLAGDSVVAALWAEFVSVDASGRWFYVESLDLRYRIGGGERTALQVQRAKDRLTLLKRSLDAGQGLRAVLQTNRVAVKDMEIDKAAKVSVRVADDQEWHVATWDPVRKVAVLVRGERGWLPDEDALQAAGLRGNLPPVAAPAGAGGSSADQVQVAAMAYLTRHFAGYGYKADDVRDQHLGHDLVVSDKKGATLLKLAVKGSSGPMTGFQLTDAERLGAQQGDPWRLAVVTDAQGPTAQHKLYKPTELNNAPGFGQPPAA